MTSYYGRRLGHDAGESWRKWGDPQLRITHEPGRTSRLALVLFGLIAMCLGAAIALGPVKAANPELAIHSTGFFAGGFPYTVVGEGFRPNTAVPLLIAEPGCCRFRTVTTDANGAFTYTDTTTDTGGRYEIRAHYRNDQTGRLREVASVDWTVLVR